MLDTENTGDVMFSTLIDPQQTYPRSIFMPDIGFLEDGKYRGEGIKIGIIDYPITKRDGTLLHADQVADHVTEEKYKGHGEDVYDILTYFAPDADYYFTFPTSYRGIIDCIRELSEDCDVDVINYSGGGPHFGVGPGCYTTDSAEIDRIISKEGVALVISSGNEDTAVHCGAASVALNSISVGSNSRGRGESYFTVDSVDQEYEDVLAPITTLAPGDSLYGIGKFGQVVNPMEESFTYSGYSGTSFSAPVVSGISALLMEEFPILKNSPIMLKNIIRNSNTDGILSYQDARVAASNGTWVNTSPSDFDGVLLNAVDLIIPDGYKLIATTTVRFDPPNFNSDGWLIIDEEAVLYSKFALSLNEKTPNGLFKKEDSALTDRYGNFFELSFSNHSGSDKEYRLELNLDGEPVKNDFEEAAFTWRVVPDDYGSISELSTPYLDQTQSYVYYLPEEATNARAVFVDFRNDEIFSKNLNSASDLVNLTNQEWADLINVTGPEFYCYLTYSLQGREIQTLASTFREPTTFKSRTQILPSDFDFPEWYPNDPVSAQGVSIKDITMDISRLRCGYIEDQYLNLSPRKAGQGQAYLQIEFKEKLPTSVAFGVTMWRNSELMPFREGDSFKVYVKSNGKWSEAYDILNDVPGFSMMERREVARLLISRSSIEGIKFEAMSNPTGSSNSGRVCIDDLVLNFANTENGFVLTQYEPIVERRSFDDGSL